MLQKLLKDYRLVLGSQSPRRHELLKGLDITFEQHAMPDIDESYPEGLPPVDIPLFIAKEKAKAYLPGMRSNTLLITADTVVFSDNGILGKPKDKDDAIRMLEILSGREHSVITGVAITTLERQTAFTAESRVRFTALTREEIEYYIERYRPYDKAGSYGVQEWIGYVGIEHIEGSFYNVMGMPVHRLYHELISFVKQ